MAKEVSEVDDDEVCFQLDPLTRRGRLTVLISLVGMPLIPALALLIYAIYYVVVDVRRDIQEPEIINTFAVLSETYDVISALQAELESVTANLVNNDSVLFSSPSEQYEKTELVIELTHGWPSSLDKHFPSKTDYLAQLQQLRRGIESPNVSVLAAVDKYSVLWEALIDWLVGRLYEATAMINWTTVVAYQFSLDCLSVLAVEKVLGNVFFARGWLTPEEHDNFLEMRTLADIYLQHSMRHDARMSMWYDRISLTQVHVVRDMETEVDIIESGESDLQLLYHAVIWHRTTSSYMDTLITASGLFTMETASELQSFGSLLVGDIAFEVILILFALLVVLPFTVISASNAVGALYSFARTTQSRHLQMRREKRRTENLLREMLPRTVSYRLLHGEKVVAENFGMVTVMFSDVPDFNKITQRSAPLDIVLFLNELYTLMDDHIVMYDVYKVETIGCEYMVASGVPSRNGDRHATELGRMGLDILRKVEKMDIVHLPDTKLDLRLGMHSG